MFSKISIAGLLAMVINSHAGASYPQDDSAEWRHVTIGTGCAAAGAWLAKDSVERLSDHDMPLWELALRGLGTLVLFGAAVVEGERAYDVWHKKN